MKSRMIAPAVFLLFFLYLGSAAAELVALQGRNISVDITVSEPKANEPFNVWLTFYHHQTAVRIQNAKASFRMKMNMGKFIFVPEFVESENRYLIQGIILPRCMSGDARWYLDLQFTIDNISDHIEYAFEIK